jgi:hypothetical protein
MKTMVSLNGYLATRRSVGDWKGQEKLAAYNLNRIYQAVYDASPKEIDERTLRKILLDVRNDWLVDGSDLLSLTIKQIEAYAQAKFLP